MPEGRDVSPKQVIRWQEDLRRFREAYVAYLNATVLAGRHPTSEPQLRSQVSRFVPAAQAALGAIQAEVGWDLRHSGGPLILGLVNMTFLHETSHGYSGGLMPGVPPYQAVLDTIDGALASLEVILEEVRRQRRNPIYWLDRLLRTVLGFPAYFVSLVFRVPLDRIEESPYGTPLRLLGLVIEGTLVYIGGRELGWW